MIVFVEDRLATCYARMRAECASLSGDMFDDSVFDNTSRVVAIH